MQNYKKFTFIFLSIFMIIFGGFSSGTLKSDNDTVEVDLEGAVVGKWTQDYDAAVKLAKDKKLPIIINFTGSDWCGWCKLMEKNVFQKEDWKTYAKDNMVMVFIDSPNDKTKVPAKYIQRNEELKNKFKVSGFPTFILLDEDNATQLGKLGAGKDKNPENFISDINNLCRYREIEILKYAETLKEDAKKEYLRLTDLLVKSKSKLADQNRLIIKYTKEANATNKTLEGMFPEIQSFRAKQLGEEAFAKYSENKTSLDKAIKELEAWIATKPGRSQENQQKYGEMQKAITAIQAKLNKY